jgi:hypothetical protein
MNDEACIHHATGYRIFNIRKKHDFGFGPAREKEF